MGKVPLKVLSVETVGKQNEHMVMKLRTITEIVEVQSVHTHLLVSPVVGGNFTVCAIWDAEVMKHFPNISELLVGVTDDEGERMAHQFAHAEMPEQFAGAGSAFMKFLRDGET